MEQRSFYIRSAIVLVLAFAWLQLAQRLFFPAPQKPPVDAVAVAPELDAAKERPAADGQQQATASDASGESSEAEPSPPSELVRHEKQTVELGSLETDSGYFALVTLTSSGAAVESVQLNDPRYTPIEDRSQHLKIVGNNPQTELRTFQTSIKQIDEQLRAFDTSLAQVDWEVVPESRTQSEVTFRYRAPDGSLEIRKHYRLQPGDPQARDSDPRGYQLDVALEVENLGTQPQKVVYFLQGPVGLPLEDEENSQTHISVKAGTLEDPASPDSVSAVGETAAAIVKQFQKLASDPAALNTWQSPLKYVGVDVQYFAALVFPEENQLQSRTIAEARPVLVSEDVQKPAWSDVSVVLESEPLTVEPGQTKRHEFQAFFGPKHDELLEPLSATGVESFGWFAIISRGMLAVLNFFHKTLGVPYGVAIILLTIVVRACMFPISRKMAQNQQRMKELQPKMQEIRTKYKDDQEKMALAYREFMAKNGFNPLAGCLPALLQLPIFMGLYQALYNSVDLRMARFLWIENLAAPDQLFPFGFTVPFVGWTHFNLLPLITVGLMVYQQRTMMPPPTSEEQEMQQKMMKFFFIIMGFMFYRWPSGLGVYFITSSLWGMAERKLLGLTDHVKAEAPTETASTTTSSEPEFESASLSGRPRGDGGKGKRAPAPESPKPAGFLQRLMEAADQARESSTKLSSTREERPPKRSGGKGGSGRKAKHRR